ncbi:hypothetical protein [Sphingomonas japonica]|uniref:DNA pilot protein n=1 Tax=Sphingomonas japonica TaxID=511662 RepID=A0ABX0U2X2_9SPHN|nr:hypothetical protein [Sphingomonas japonica]NIJ24838.1 hypothetical protein [Sphingomonas japonica]
MGIFGASIMPGVGKVGLNSLAALHQGDEQPPVIQPFKPNTTQKIFGVLGDSLSIAGGGSPSFGPMLQRQREMAMQQQQAQLERANDYADWQRKQEYQAANPGPQRPTALQQNYEYLKGLNPALAEQFIQNEATAPPVVVQNPDGTRTVYPSGAIPRGPAPQRPPVGARVSDPRTAGGPTPTASGTFRQPF